MTHQTYPGHLERPRRRLLHLGPRRGARGAGPAGRSGAGEPGDHPPGAALQRGGGGPGPRLERSRMALLGW